VRDASLNLSSQARSYKLICARKGTKFSFKFERPTYFMPINQLGHGLMFNCCHIMAHHQVADGGQDLKIRRINANILNKQLLTTYRHNKSCYPNKKVI
jgi:hypothetical protein